MEHRPRDHLFNSWPTVHSLLLRLISGGFLTPPGEASSPARLSGFFVGYETTGSLENLREASRLLGECLVPHNFIKQLAELAESSDTYRASIRCDHLRFQPDSSPDFLEGLEVLTSLLGLYSKECEDVNEAFVSLSYSFGIVRFEERPPAGLPADVARLPGRILAVLEGMEAWVTASRLIAAMSGDIALLLMEATD
jgi:hypothetical protein